MRNLKRNETAFEYFPLKAIGGDVNEDGDHTGEYSDPEYDDPIPCKGNISAPSGQTNQTFYGLDIRYTHTLVMSMPCVDIREDGKIRWKGNMYDVKAVRPSLNVLSVALRKQTEDHSDELPYIPDDPEETEESEGEG